MKLVKIVIPSWHCQESFLLILLTDLLVVRTFLSIYLTTVNGRIVKSIVKRQLGEFGKRVSGRV